MDETNGIILLESQIDQWRSYLQRRQVISESDVVELEDHLRELISRLIVSGLDTDEAFLVAVKRMGDLNELSREFALEHSDRLWKQLVLMPEDSEQTRAASQKDTIIAVSLAIGAALLIKLPSLFGVPADAVEAFYMRNIAFLVLPLICGYFVWKRGLSAKVVAFLATAFGAAALFVNAYPFMQNGSTFTLAVLHLPIALWIGVLGIAYAGRRWRESSGRMDFIRFSGELLIYYVLIALGGGVLMALTAMIFQAIGVDIEPFFSSWVLPCGAAGALVIASWLVEAKQNVIENMAPVLTRLFSPLFVIVLVTFIVTVVLTGNAIDIDRDVLIVFDLLLVVVLALVVYSISAREESAQPRLFDVLQTVLIVSALSADAVALWAIAARITEYGVTPNRIAALGMNVILLVNLVWSAVLYLRFIRRNCNFVQIEQWQTNYLPVYVAWASIVVIVFPLIFGFK